MTCNIRALPLLTHQMFLASEKHFPVILRSTISLPCLVSLMLGKWRKLRGRWQGRPQRSFTFLSPQVGGDPHQKEHQSKQEGYHSTQYLSPRIFRLSSYGKQVLKLVKSSQYLVCLLKVPEPVLDTNPKLSGENKFRNGSSTPRFAPIEFLFLILIAHQNAP